MIPKIIHLCWLSGDPYPPLITKCLESWKKLLPDYEIKIWSKNTFDIDSVRWVKEAFEKKKYAFAADYIRFYALYHFGGIYLDADVEIIKSFDSLLDRDYFLGEEASGDVEAAVIGAVSGLEWIKECLCYYEDRPFILRNDKLDIRPVPLLINSKIKPFKLQLFPYTYFSPKDYNIGKIKVTENTFCIHHFDGKWVGKDVVSQLKKIIHKIIYGLAGRTMHNKIIRVIRPYINH